MESSPVDHRSSRGIDPTLSTAYAVLGVVAANYEWNWANAENAFERAIELDADDARAHEAYAMYLLRMGRFDEALRAIKRAQLLDPLSVGVRVNVGNILYIARRYDQAIDELRRAVEMGPNARAPHFWFGRALKRNRSFFFFSYEGTRIVSAAPRIATVPTDALREGRLGSTRIFDPSTTEPNPNGPGFIRSPFPANTVPRDRWDPVAAKLVRLRKWGRPRSSPTRYP